MRVRTSRKSDSCFAGSFRLTDDVTGTASACCSVAFFMASQHSSDCRGASHQWPERAAGPIASFTPTVYHVEDACWRQKVAHLTHIQRSYDRCRASDGGMGGITLQMFPSVRHQRLRFASIAAAS